MGSSTAVQEEAQVIVVDANIVVSSIVGVAAKRALSDAFERGVKLFVPEPQLAEAASVLLFKLRATRGETEIGLDWVTTMVEPLAPSIYEPFEGVARGRLQQRAQPDWPVLAAALAFDGAVWSHDHDFFGTGVAIWSTRNMRFAEA